jgi:hypothetical protein
MLQEHNVRSGFFEREQFEIVRSQLPEAIRPGGHVRVSDWLAHSQRGTVAVASDRSAGRNLERAGVSRSVAMQLTGHKTEAVYRRYAIVSESDLGAGLDKLHGLETGAGTGADGKKGRVRRFRRSP